MEQYNEILKLKTMLEEAGIHSNAILSETAVVMVANANIGLRR